MQSYQNFGFKLSEHTGGSCVDSLAVSLNLTSAHCKSANKGVPAGDSVNLQFTMQQPAVRCDMMQEAMMQWQRNFKHTSQTSRKELIE